MKTGRERKENRRGGRVDSLLLSTLQNYAKTAIKYIFSQPPLFRLLSGYLSKHVKRALQRGWIVARKAQDGARGVSWDTPKRSVSYGRAEKPDEGSQISPT